ncbi:MAG: hypothetical protein WCV50_00600 [Patescibacteria group bacterium]|jgi:rod shape-determining protein MreD
MTKWITFGIFAILIALFQISFLFEFNIFNQYLNLIVLMVVLFSILKDYKTALIFAIISGLVLDIYSPFSFGIITLSLAATVPVMHVIFIKFIAHKSIFTLILAIIVSLLVYNLVLWSFTNIFYWLGWNDFTIKLNPSYLNNLIIQLAFQIILMSIIYFSLKFIKTKFRNKFIFSV